MPRPRTVRDDDLLAATARVVDVRGPVAFTLAEAAKEAGVSAPLLVQRFGSKRGLLLALAKRSAADVDGRFERARAAHAAPLAALVAALAEGAAQMRTPQAVANGLAFLQLDVTDPEFNEHTRAFFRALRAAIARQLDDAMRAGELRRADVPTLARGVEAAYQGAIIAWAIHQEGTAADAVRAEVEALLKPYRAQAG